MILIERVKVYSKKSELYTDLDMLCFQSKNVFNSALYVIKQAFLKKEKIPSYNDLDKLWRQTNNIDYRSLPYNQCSQQTMRCCYSLLKGFFSQIKSNKVNHKVNLPHYYDSAKGRYKCIYTSQCFKQEGEHVRLKLNKEGKYLYIRVGNGCVQQVTILPVANGYAIDVAFKVNDVQLKENNERYAGGDLGVNNLLTLTSNIAQSTVIDGKRIKSINHHYNKKIAYLKSCLKKNKYTSRRIKQITNKRNNKVKDYMHKASNIVVKYCVSNDISYIIIGKNDKWKNECNLGKQVNQNFIMIPHSKLVNMIKYKCRLAGVNAIIVNEAYTSKCSFLDNETICKHDTYHGCRVKRGLFQSGNGKLINADVNGSYNIMRLGLEKIKCNCDALSLMPADKRFVYNPVRLKI